MMLVSPPFANTVPCCVVGVGSGEKIFRNPYTKACFDLLSSKHLAQTELAAAGAYDSHAVEFASSLPH
jgi:hypothetical protein